ncbi:hypothetical protein ABZ329_29175 [Streptomyces rubiginosohelvolus]|uniref:hypothetical protein n=1 Tax=Streptomyces rubiginosohelvolus TaxID=67362 RepID=UPI0033F020AB
MTDTPMTPERERMIRIWHEELHRLADPTAVARREALGDLLAEVDRLRGDLSDATGRVDFLERNTLPDLHRQIEHHKDGKARWRTRAETAEARVAELETRPTVGYAVWCVEQSLGDEAAQHLLDLNPDLKGTP